MSETDNINHQFLIHRLTVEEFKRKGEVLDLSLFSSFSWRSTSTVLATQTGIAGAI